MTANPSARRGGRALPLLLFLAAAALLLLPFEEAAFPWSLVPRWSPLVPPAAALLAALGAALFRRFRQRHPSPWFLPLHLGTTFALGWAVKLLYPSWPFVPLLFPALFPFSLLLRPREDQREVTFASFWVRPDILWLPLLSLLLPALGLALLPPADPGLLPWAGGFFLFGLLAALAHGWWLYESWYRQARAKDARLWRDAEGIGGHVEEGAPLVDEEGGRLKRSPQLAFLIKEQDLLLQEVLKLGLGFFAARSGVFLLFREGGFEVRAMATGKGLGGKSRAAFLPLDDPLVRDAVKAGLFLVEGSSRRRPEEFPFYEKGVKVGSFVMRIIEAGDDSRPWFGAVYFDSPESGYFGDDEVNRQQVDRIVSAIRRIYGLSETMRGHLDLVDHHRLQEEYASSLTRTLDPVSIASQAVQCLVQVLPPPRCEGWAVVLVEPDRMWVPVAEGILGGVRDDEMPLDVRSVVGSVVRQGCEPLQPGIRRGPLPRDQGYFHPGERLGRDLSFCCHASAMRQEGRMEIRAVLAVASRKPEGIGQGDQEWVGMLADMTAPALANAFTHREVERLSRTDPLTGLDNRRTFMAALEKKMRRMERYPQEEPFALLLADLDHFKKVNDEHGHPVGDEVLREAARRIRASLREFDTVGRYGGEEFIALLDRVRSEKDASAIAEKLCQVMRGDPVPTQAGPLPVRASLGFALYRREEGVTLQELVDRADQALYQAKETGRDRVVGYSAAGRAPRALH